MDNILLHLLIPVLALRIISYFYKIDKKTILLLSPIAIFPDIDYFIGFHRATLHNIFAGIGITIIAVLAMRLMKVDWKKAMFAGMFYFAFHLLIDSGGVILFYPFTLRGIDIFGRVVRIEDLQGYAVPAGFFLNYGIAVGLAFALLVLEVIIEERNKTFKAKKA